MKFNDDITMSIAAAVSNVLEGKAPEEKKEEVKYPHDMFHPKTGEKEVAKDEAGHKALAAKGYTHDKPKMESPDQPKAKGEKEFKKMHDDNVEVSGEAPDGEVTKAKKGNYYKEEVEEVTISVSEKLNKSGKATLDIDYIGGKDLTKKLEKKFKVKIKQTGSTTADITGDRKNIINLLKSDAYLMDEDEIEDTFSELTEDYNKKNELTRLKRIDKMAMQIGKEIRNFPRELTDDGTDDKDLAQAFYDMNTGLGDLDNGISDFEYALKRLKESVEDEEVDEESEKQKKYQAFFNKALKKFGVSSPAELEGDKKKEFFDYIDKNYEATDESVKEDVRDMKNYKDRDRKGHEAYMSIQVVKGNTSNKFDDGFGFSKAEMVMMDKLISKIKNMHVSSFDGGSSGPASLEFYGDEASLKKFIADKNVQKIVKKYKGKVSGPNKA